MEIEYVVKRELVDEPTARVGKGHSILTVPCVSLAGPDPLTSVMKPYDEFKKPIPKNVPFGKVCAHCRSDLVVFEDGYQCTNCKQIEKDGYFRLSSWENGGAKLSAGEAEVVCGLNGECLRPVTIKRAGNLVCSLHALFVGEGLVVVKASHYRKTYSIEITEYVINSQTDGQTDGSVRAKILWKANLGLVMNPDEFIKNELPAPYKEFGLAIKSSMEKAQHLQCREPHYYISAPSAPRVIIISGDSQVELNWSPPSFEGGAPVSSPVIKYTVYRAIWSKLVNWSMIGEVNAPTTRYVDKGLVNGQKYIYGVSASNSVGEGPKFEITSTPMK